MENAKISKDFSNGKYTDRALSTKCQHIIDKMTGNEAFATPKPTLIELAAALSSYNAAMGKAENGSKSDTVVKNNWRKTLGDLMKELADYVQITSEGDEAIILSSGFDVNKKAATIGPLPKPENFKIEPGINKGSVLASCNAVQNAYVYEFEYIEMPVTPSSIWIKRISTKHKTVIDGLISGKQYSYRVTAVGSDPTRNMSDEISSFVI
jgi:hypothetical protein